MTMLCNANAIGGGVDTGDIGHSLRFRSAATAYLSRTTTSAGNQQKWTWSGWIKRGKLTALQGLFQAFFDANNRTTIGLGNSNDELFFADTLAGVTTVCSTTALLRDPSSHLYLVVAVDTTQAVAADRTKMYINGAAASMTGSFVPQNRNMFVNENGRTHYIGNEAGGAGRTLDGYVSRIAFVDGQALTPSSFGYLNTETNEWTTKSAAEVKSVVDAGGANSFMLEFDDGTSLTTLGNDFSSKNNDWTLNNFSLTAGTSYDWMLDVPGNSFATLNPLIPSAANITNGNLTSGTTAVRGTQNALLFDCKWEVTAGGSAVTAGVISATGTTNTTSVTANKTFAFRLTTSGALDYKNVTDAGAWTSITTGLTGEQYPYGVTQAANWNFGQAPLHASATYQSSAGGYFFDTTSGFKALCQRNLPDGEVITTSGTFTGNLNADGPYVDIKGVPLTMTINSNAVTFGTHADKTAFGFKVRSSSASYNNTGSNSFSITSTGPKQKYSLAKGNP